MNSRAFTVPLFLVCCIFLLSPRTGLCQGESLADSLHTLLLTAPPDTHRVHLLFDYAWELVESDTEKADSCLHVALTLAQQLSDKPGEAAVWNGLGVVEEARGNNRAALDLYQKALTLRLETGDQSGAARILTNQGLVYESLGEFPAAVAKHRESLAIYTDLKDTLRMARAHSNISKVLSSGGAYPDAFAELNTARLLLENKGDIGTTYKLFSQMGHNRFDVDMFDDARAWYEKSLQLRQRTNDPVAIADGLNDLANALDELKNEDSTQLAVDYYRKALQLYESIDDQASVAAICNNLGDAFKHLGRYNEARQYLRRSERIRIELEDLPGLMETYNTLNDVLSRQNKPREALEYVRKYAAIADSIGNQNYKLSSLKDFARAYAQLGDYARAYDYAVRYNEERFKALGEKRAQNIETQQALTAAKEKELALDRAKTEAYVKEAELSRARTFRNALIGGAILLMLLAALLYNRNRLRARANRMLSAKNEAIEQERQRADALLKNILPEKTAAELKEAGSVKPVYYPSVTVLFTDFKNFTSIAENMSPEALVAELDAYFKRFDAIVAKHGLEKIKTIGDAYMCAGGLPEPNETHAENAVRAAIEMQQALLQMAAESRDRGGADFEMRIGIHTGPVVAGVVGSHKFAYDIWGDTVNTAARMEQNSLPGKINISEATWKQVRHLFSCTFRGHLPAKNKGEIAMYFVEPQAA